MPDLKDPGLTESPVRDFQNIPLEELAAELPKGADTDMHGDPDMPEDHPPDILEAPPRWRVAKALLTLRGQVNTRAPNRSKASDGTIGDPSHQSRTSDHNAWVRDSGEGVVTAMDVTHDPGDGCDAGLLAQSLVDSRDRRIKYIIWNRRIANSSAVGGAAAWAWRAYRGSNPHNHHTHISVKSDKPSYDSTTAWTFNTAPTA